jgi:anti-sigma-K factor RskA
MNETEHDRWRDDLAAYALGALEPGEAADLERHIAGCEECKVELDWLRPAAQVLPESVERLEPPVELRARLFEQVHSEAPRPEPSAAPRRARWLALRPVAGLAAAVLVVAAIGAYAISGGGSDGGNETTVAAGHAPGVTAKIVSEGDSGTLRLANVDELPADKVLQAWVQRGERVESAKTLFLPNRDGTATAVIDDMQGVSAVMVTMEPRGGSAQPTTEPMVTLTMPT